MASADVKAGGEQGWIFANPWAWLAAGAAFTLWSLSWTLIYRENASDSRVVVLACGLLLAGVGVWLKWNDRETAYILPCSKPLANLARLAMGGLFGFLALAITVLFVRSWFQNDPLTFKPGVMLLVWLSVVPVSLFAARGAIKRDPKQPPLEANQEVALSFVAAAGIVFAGSWTLYLGAARAHDWDTIRLLLRVLTSVCLLAAALVLVSSGLRRLVLSLLVALHFAAIILTCLSAPPAPWLIIQIQLRLFRPYLDFMYLNNAYHFYAPAPAESSHIWFRLIYTSPEDGRDYGFWYKIPHLDDKGRVTHPNALEYQRYLALTEAIALTEPPPPGYLRNGQENPFYVRRLSLVPVRPGEKKDIVGIDVRGYVPIPKARMMGPLQQVAVPSDSSQRLLESYARFVARKFATHPEQPTWTFKSVKIYRVIHLIVASPQLNLGMSPTDPELNRVFYVGNYLADGAEIDLDDPYRHWLLPVLRDSMNDPESGIKDYARLHAEGVNARWYRPRGQNHWVELELPPGGIPDEMRN